MTLSGRPCVRMKTQNVLGSRFGIPVVLLKVLRSDLIAESDIAALYCEVEVDDHKCRLFHEPLRLRRCVRVVVGDPLVMEYRMPPSRSTQKDLLLLRKTRPVNLTDEALCF